MTDTSNPFAALSGFFLAGDKNDPRVNPQLRQRIALALMARGTKYPKNLGEGLSAIGEAIGDRGLQRMLEQQDLAQQGIAPPPAAGPAQGTSYSPPDDSVQNAPAVRAIEAATSQPQVIPPPAPPPAPPQAPGRGAVPLPMQPGAGEVIDPGEYNAIDAADPRNRYKPAPAYLAPALERNIVDPERRAYLGQLAGKEAQSAGEVSPTGAAGPFQFTRGTGAQYGIPGSARFDPDASTLAANAFTDDNVKALTARLGREPTPGEMALAHQQGAGTAANMLTGAGNASASNLAVNNVPPGVGPGAAAQKIMGYYGMPGAAGGGRDAVAAALAAQQQQPPPSGRPTVADYGQPLALAATPGPDAGNGIQVAPPSPSGIRAAPPQQAAQAQPQAIPGYVPPEAKDPSAAPIIGMKPREVELRNWLVQNQNNPYAAPKVAAELQALEQERTIRQNEANEKYKADLTQARSQNDMREKARMDQATRIPAAQEAQAKASMASAKAAIAERIGGKDPDAFLTDFAKERDATEQSVNILKQSKLAKQALNEGIVSGSGADFRVNMEKLKAMFGNDSAAQLAARSEQYMAAVKSTLSGAIQNIQGHDPKVTDSDVKVASGLIGADLNLQKQTLHKLVDQTIESQHQRLNKYEDLKDYYLGGTRLEKMYDVRTDPTVTDKRFIDRLVENKNDPEARRQFDQRFGSGAAELEIARAQRQGRRPQSGGQ